MANSFAMFPGSDDAYYRRIWAIDAICLILAKK